MYFLNCVREGFIFFVAALNLVMLIVYIKCNNFISPLEKPDKFYDSLSLQITLLDTIVVVATIILSVLGVVGYSNIRLAAIEEAKKAADEYLKNNMATQERVTHKSEDAIDVITHHDKICKVEDD